MDSDIRHPGRREGERLLEYILRVNHGIDRRDPIDRLMEDHGLTYSEACEVEFGHLFRFDNWQDFARHRWQIRQADKDVGFTLEAITASTNLMFNLNLSVDAIYHAVCPERQSKQKEYDKRSKDKHREKVRQRCRDYYRRHREQLSANALERYHRKMADGTYQRTSPFRANG